MTCYKKAYSLTLGWWYPDVNPVFRRLKQETLKLEASLELRHETLMKGKRETKIYTCQIMSVARHRLHTCM